MLKTSTPDIMAKMIAVLTDLNTRKSVYPADSVTSIVIAKIITPKVTYFVRSVVHSGRLRIETCAPAQNQKKRSRELTLSCFSDKEIMLVPSLRSGDIANNSFAFDLTILASPRSLGIV